MIFKNRLKKKPDWTLIHLIGINKYEYVNPLKAGVAIIIIIKPLLKIENNFIMIKDFIHQGNINIFNIYALYNIGWKYIKQK